MSKIYPVHRLVYSYAVQLPHSAIDLEIRYKVLSKKQLIDSHNICFNSLQQSSNLFKQIIIDYSVLPEYKSNLELLSDKDYEKLFNNIMKVSIIDDELLKRFENIFWLQQEKELKSDNWDCEICKEKELQNARNCPLIDIDEKDKNFSMVLDGKIYKECPVGLFVKNSELLSSAYRCYNMYKQGILPEQGGFYDQSVFFVEFSLLIDRLVNEAERKEIEKMKTKG